MVIDLLLALCAWLLRANYRRIAKFFTKIVGFVEESLMTSFLAYEFYHIHINTEVLLQKIAINTFSAAGCFLHFSPLGKRRKLLWTSKNGQDLSDG